MFQNTPEDMLCDRGGEYRQYRNKYEEKERKNVMSLKNNKHFRRFAAALMAGTMMVSMFGMTAFAQGNNGGETTEPVTAITKKIDKDANLYLPATEFEFSIRPATSTEGVGNTKDGITIQAGVPGGVVFSSTNTTTATILSNPSNNNTVTAGLIDVGTLQINVVDSAFVDSTVGIYRYVIEETDGTYPGMDYDTAARYLDVYVMNSDNGAGHEFYFSIVNSTDTSKKADGVITNTYKYSNGGLYDLKVTKQIEGSQGNLSEEFAFVISVDPDNDGEKLYAVVYEEGGTLKTVETIQPGEDTDTGYSVTVSLGNGDYVVVYGLSAGDRYTVTETAADQNGYETTCVVENGVGTPAENGGSVANDTDINGDIDITFTNTRNASTPTGVVLNIAPYIAMVALAGVLAFVFLRRRHNNF